MALKQMERGGTGGLGQIFGLLQTGIGIATGNPGLIMSGIGSTTQGTELEGISPLMKIIGGAQMGIGAGSGMGGDSSFFGGGMGNDRFSFLRR